MKPRLASWPGIASLLLMLWLGAASGRASPPNVVLIIADDMGFGDYGFMGHSRIRTPRLDRLAAASLAFRRGYVTTSLCSPSLAAILSGQYPHRHGVTSNDPPLPSGRFDQPKATHEEMLRYFDKMPSLPRVLARSGYLSFQSGKWWGGSYERGGFTHGMSHGDPARGGRHGDVGLEIGRSGLKPVFDFVDLAQSRGAPFLLWYAPMMPHSPHNPPARLFDHYRTIAPTIEIAKYWAMCEWFDETCGELLDFLDARRLVENTIVIYLADNGWIQDPGADRYAPGSKQSPYEGGIRTPILVRWPGKVIPRVCDTPVSAVDIAPTVLSATGQNGGPHLDGINLLDERSVKARAAIFGELFTHNAVDLRNPASSLRFRWVVAGDWKLIVPNRVNEPNRVVELFNLVQDPAETRNLANTEPNRVSRLRSLVDAWWNAGG
jgi:uncharacterized sulfatase